MAFGAQPLFIARASTSPLRDQWAKPMRGLIWVMIPAHWRTSSRVRKRWSGQGDNNQQKGPPR
jgi:hypothetical protein